MTEEDRKKKISEFRSEIFPQDTHID